MFLLWFLPPLLVIALAIVYTPTVLPLLVRVRSVSLLPPTCEVDIHCCAPRCTPIPWPNRPPVSLVS